jgi:hypothetical protein
VLVSAHREGLTREDLLERSGLFESISDSLWARLLFYFFIITG